MRVLLGDLCSQRRKARMRRIAVLLLDRDPRSLFPHKIRCRQIRLAQTEIDAVGQGAFEELPDQGRLKAAESARQNKSGSVELLCDSTHPLPVASSRSFSFPSSRSSSISSRRSPTSTLNSPSACVFGSPVSMPPIVSISPIIFCPRPLNPSRNECLSASSVSFSSVSAIRLFLQNKYFR